MMELMQSNYEQYTAGNRIEQSREESLEVIVPDTLPDIYGILTTFGVCQIRQKLLRQDTVLLEGAVEMEAVCLGEDESLQYVKGTVPFSQEYVLSGCTEESVTEVHVEVARAETQLRNPRKLQFQAQLAVSAQLYQKQYLTVSENIRADDEEKMEVLRDTTELEILRAVGEKKLVAADEFTVEAAGHLLRYEVEWQQEEMRVLSGKVMLRGDALVKAVFLEKTESRSCEVRVPFSQVVECEGCEPGDTVTTDYQTLQSHVTLLEGEETVLSCNLTGKVWTKILKKSRFTVLRDAYSTCYETQCSEVPLQCPVCREYKRVIPVSEQFQPEEHAVRVTDCRWQARGTVEAGGKLCGVYHFRILYFCSQGKLHCAEYSIRAFADEGIAAEKLVCRPCLRELSVQAEPDGQIALRFRAVLLGTGVEMQSGMQVGSCTVDREKKRQRPAPGTLVLRNVEEKETVWSIARHYGAVREEILSANHLEEESLTPGQLLMIPFSR